MGAELDTARRGPPPCRWDIVTGMGIRDLGLVGDTIPCRTRKARETGRRARLRGFPRVLTLDSVWVPTSGVGR